MVSNHFSIVVPLFNKANYISLTINSILAQTYVHYEIIIINDGSTDNSLEIVSKFSYNDKVKIFSIKNSGVSIARNIGISQSKNKFIAFLDADDLWENDFLETINGLINKFPNAGIFATSYCYIGVDGARIKPRLKFINNTLDGELINDYCKSASYGDPPITASSICIPKNVFDKVGKFPEGVKRGEDLDMWLRIACHFEIAFINKTKVYYVINSENNCNKKFGNINESFPYVKWKNYQYFNKSSLHKYVFKLRKSLFKKAILNGKLKDAFFYFLQ